WNRLVHETGVRNHPLKSLHATHGRSRDCFQVVNMQHLSEQLVFAAHHVSHCELREFHVRLQLAVGGRTGNPISQRINGDHEIFGAVHHSAGPESSCQLSAIPAEPDCHQHRV